VDSFNRPTFEPSTEVGIRSNLQEDLYIVYAGSVEGTEESVYRFNINPLVWWVWFGGGVLMLGGLITLWPGGGPVTRPRPAQAGYEVTLVGAGASER
jgi:cytochrome c-type biogenesis protein CcmF